MHCWVRIFPLKGLSTFRAITLASLFCPATSFLPSCPISIIMIAYKVTILTSWDWARSSFPLACKSRQKHGQICSVSTHLMCAHASAVDFRSAAQLTYFNKWKRGNSQAEARERSLVGRTPIFKLETCYYHIKPSQPAFPSNIWGSVNLSVWSKNVNDSHMISLLTKQFLKLKINVPLNFIFRI